MQNQQIVKRYGQCNKAGTFSFLYLTKNLKKFDHTNIKIMHYWIDIIGPELANDVYPIKITTEREKGFFVKTLQVGVKNAVTAMLLDFQKDLIIERITAFLGKEIIQKLKIIQSNNSITNEMHEENEEELENHSKFDIDDEELNRVLSSIDYFISKEVKS